MTDSHKTDQTQRTPKQAKTKIYTGTRKTAHWGRRGGVGRMYVLLCSLGRQRDGTKTKETQTKANGGHSSTYMDVCEPQATRGRPAKTTRTGPHPPTRTHTDMSNKLN